MTTATNNQIIKGTFNHACDNNKFRTFAGIMRNSGVRENFSAECNKEVFNGMTFEEWASYSIGDDDWGYLEQSKMDAFVKLSKEKGIYAEEQTSINN